MYMQQCIMYTSCTTYLAHFQYTFCIHDLMYTKCTHQKFCTFAIKCIHNVYIKIVPFFNRERACTTLVGRRCIHILKLATCTYELAGYHYSGRMAGIHKQPSVYIPVDQYEFLQKKTNSRVLHIFYYRRRNQKDYS